MTTLPSGLPVVLDRAASIPLAVQISDQLEAACVRGVLHAGDRLPSSRDLASTLGVSRTVVTNAYARLFAEGWLEGRHGSGTYVADVTPAPAPAPAAPAPAPAGSFAQTPASIRANCAIDPGGNSDAAPWAAAAGVIQLRPGISWAEGIEPAMWRRAWRRAGDRLPSMWPDEHGVPELRAEVASYLRRSRGLAVSAANVLITQGVSSGLALLADAIVQPGDRVGVEEPGYATARAVLTRAGAVVLPCRVDAHGVVVQELPDDLRLLYTTPAHQYPLGGRLPVRRRQSLIAWARATGALVVEDDYDSEFRYDVGPLPAMFSMDPDVIVYLGTASKMLATAFGAGWLVASAGLVERMAALRPRLGVRIPEPVQYAVLALLSSGDLERHVRKVRLEYARRRAVLVGALAAIPEPAPFRLLGDTAGMHVVLELPDRLPAARLVAAAAARGVEICTLDRYFAGEPAMNGVILGYGTATLPQLRRAATELARLLTTAPPFTRPASTFPAQSPPVVIPEPTCRWMRLK